MQAQLQAQLQQMMQGAGGGGGNPLARLVGMGQPRGGPPAIQGPRPWIGLPKFDEVTQDELAGMLQRLRAAGRSELTLLLLGKPGVGKTSVMNSLFNETASPAAAFRNMPTEVEVVSRTHAGFTLTIVDTPGLSSGDAVSAAAVQAIRAALGKRPIDLCLYVERLDVYRSDGLDLAVARAVTTNFGADLWNNTLLCLTHAGLEGLPPGESWENYVERRSAQCQRIIRRAGGFRDMPVALAENKRSVLDPASGELPDGSLWIPDLVDMLVQAVENGVAPYVLDAGAPRRAHPNRRRKWLIPLLLAAQVAFKIFVFDRVTEDDACTGDQFGPFDEAAVAENRRKLRENRGAAEDVEEEELDDMGGAGDEEGEGEDEEEEEYGEDESESESESDEDE